MSKTSIKIGHSEAKSKLNTQIETGKKLAEKALHILRDTPPHTNAHTRAKDGFVVLFDQWCDFTVDIIIRFYGDIL